MKFSKQNLARIKKKNKTLKPNLYKRLKRDSIRGKIKGTLEQPRLSIYRSNENIYAQIVDDTESHTLVSCTTNQRDIKLLIRNGRNCDAGFILGQELAKRSLKKNICKVIFDRGRYLYHGRVRAVADGAREGGLRF